MKKLITNLFLVIISLGFFGCKKSFEPPSWDADIITPIAKSNLSISNLAGGSTSLQVNADTTVSIVYSNELFDFTMDSLVAINVAPFTRNVKIDSLKLSDQTIQQSVTLGEVARQMGPPAEGIILSNHGNSAPIPGPFNGVTAGPFTVDASSFLTTATLENGFMDVKIVNGFPVEIQNVTYEIRNQSDNSLILTDNYPSIPAGDSVFSSTDLSGTTIEGVLEITITNMDIQSSGGAFVPIDTNDAITASVTLRDMQVSAATAIFPEQTIVDNTDSVALLGMDDVELKFATISSGQVEIEVLSTIQDSLFFNYQIPDASIGGIPFEVDVTVPPAPPGDTARVYLTQDFTGYDFTFENNKFNNILIGRIDSTGEIRSISKSDSVYINLGIVGLTPSFVRGYLGQDTFAIGPAISDIDIFKNIIGGTIDLEQSEFTLRVTNSLGVDGSATINNIVSTNSSTAANAVLNLGGIPMPIAIGRAIESPFSTTTTSVVINDGNSNTSQLLEILPDQLTYDLDLVTNPGGNTGACNDFAFENTSFNVALDVEVPLSLVANSLTLSDTTELNTASIDSPSQIKDGTFTFIIDNGYPLEMNLKIYFLDASDIAIDSLVSTTPIDAASVNISNRVDQSTVTKLPFEISEERMSDLLSAYKMVFVVDFTTVPTGPHIKIYDDYHVDIKLVGDFIYRFE